MPDELRDIAIKDLRFACRDSVVNIEDYIHSLLIIMPELDDDTLSSAVFAIRETEYNKYDTFCRFSNVSLMTVSKHYCGR